MKVKTAELSGRALDWAVCLATGDYEMTDIPADINGENSGRILAPIGILKSGFQLPPKGKLSACYFIRNYHNNWTLYGPLIEKFKVCVDWNTCNIDSDYDSEPWMSEAIGSEEINYGSTPQIAICRAVVASNLGDEVDFPMS